MGLVAVSSGAQLVKTAEISFKPACGAYVAAYTARDATLGTDSKYVAYMDGCSVTVLDVSSGQPEYSLDLKKVGLDSAYSVTLYRDLFSDDGSWTAIYSRYVAQTFDVYIYASGKKQLLAQKFNIYVPQFKIVDGKLYMVFKGSDSIVVYLARNDVTATSAMLRQSRFVTALDKMGLGGPLKARYDILGNSVGDAEYRSMKDYGRRTIFSR